MNKKYIYIVIGLIIVILLSLYIGKSIGNKEQKDKEIKTEIKIIEVDSKKTLKRIDSLESLTKITKKKDIQYKKKEVEYKKKAADIIIPPSPNKDCDEVYNKATEKIVLLEEVITVKDSIESNLRKEINIKDIIIDNKDKLIANKDKQLSLTKELSKPRVKKWAVSIHVGTGYGISKSNNNINMTQVPIYVGVGISRSIFSF